MEWQPIETYDALKKKPKFCAFYVRESIHPTKGYCDLIAMISTERYFGKRVVSHWVELGEPKK